MRPSGYMYTALPNPNANPDPDLWSFKLKVCTPVTTALGNVHTNFSAPSVFGLGARTGQITDERTDGQEPYCCLWRSHNQRTEVTQSQVVNKQRFTSSIYCKVKLGYIIVRSKA